MPRPYHPEDGRERVLYGFAQDNQCDGHQDEDDAEGFLPGKGLAEDKGTHTYGRHRLHGSQDGRQRAAYVVYGQHPASSIRLVVDRASGMGWMPLFSKALAAISIVVKTNT